MFTARPLNPLVRTANFIPLVPLMGRKQLVIMVHLRQLPNYQKVTALPAFFYKIWL